jgi:hypothetical protein
VSLLVEIKLAPPAAEWRALAERVRDSLKECGWAQGVMCDAAGRMCLVGAIRMASDYLGERADLYARLAAALGYDLESGAFRAPPMYGPVCYESPEDRRVRLIELALESWNDDPARREGEVLALLEKCL